MLRLIPALLIVASCGCPHRPAGPAEPLPPEQIGAILDGLSLAALSAPVEAPEACAASRAVGAGLAAAADVARAEGALLPAISVDVSGCGLALAEGRPEAGDAQAAVDAVLGVAIVAAASVRDCRARGWLVASIGWVRGAAPAIIAEIAEPSGAIQIEGTAVDLGGCE